MFIVSVPKVLCGEKSASSRNVLFGKAFSNTSPSWSSRQVVGLSTCSLERLGRFLAENEEKKLDLTNLVQ